MSGAQLDKSILGRDFVCPECHATLSKGTKIKENGLRWFDVEKSFGHETCPRVAATPPAPQATVTPSAIVPTGTMDLDKPRFGFTREQIELVKDVLAPRAKLTDDELDLFLYTSHRLGLDPLARQIYVVRYQGREGDTLSIQTSIDGYRSVAARSGALDGNDEAVFGPEVAMDSGMYPEWARVTVYRQGAAHGFTATVRWREVRRLNKDGTLGKFWVDKPYTMLGKCAEAAALRKAFPADLSGIYTADEMEQAENPARLPSPQRPPALPAGELHDADFKAIESKSSSEPSAGGSREPNAPSTMAKETGATVARNDGPASGEEEDPRLAELKVAIPHFVSRLADKVFRDSCRIRIRDWLDAHTYTSFADAQNADVPQLEALLAEISAK